MATRPPPAPSEASGAVAARKGTTHVLATGGLVALLAFVTLTFAVATSGAVNAFDVATLTWVEAHRAARATSVMLGVSLFGGPFAVAVYAGLLLVALVARGRLAMGAGVAMIAYGGEALNVVVKHMFQRGRPAAEALVHLDTYSYPSGHAAAATVFSGILIRLLLTRKGRGGTAAAGCVVLVLWICAVCASRVYLGAHYPTDVIAGVLEGVAWLLLMTLAVDRWRVAHTWPSARSKRSSDP